MATRERLSRRTEVRWEGDQTFISYDEPSDYSVLKGELFKEKERVFLRNTLRRAEVSFPIGGEKTVQLQVKVFWQPEAANFKFQGKGMRPGRFVTLLADVQAPICDAWAWIKLVRPLYRRGFSVILVDLPGAGGSAANSDTSARYEMWEHEDWRIVEMACRNLYVKRTHIVALGRSARVIMKFARHTKMDQSSFLARENCWFQADIDFFAMFYDLIGDCPPGHHKEWYASATKQHAHLLREVLKNVRSLVLFDEATAPAVCQETHQTIAAALKNEACLAELFDTRVTREDICAAQAHAALPVHILVASASLLDTVADFLWTGDQADGVHLPPPRFIPHALKKQADSADDLRACSVGCVNPEKGLHHWNCPNHPKNKGNLRYALAVQAMEAAAAADPAAGQAQGLAAASRQRPASAPTRQRPSDEGGRRYPGSPSLRAARARRGGEETWITTSQKHPAIEVTAREAQMRACAGKAKQLNPTVLGMAQHQEAMLKLPTHLRRVTLNLQQACEEKEEDRLAEELAEQAPSNPNFSPPGSIPASPSGARSPPSPSNMSQSLCSEPSLEEDFVVPPRGAPLSVTQTLSRAGSKLSKQSKLSQKSGNVSPSEETALAALEVDEIRSAPGTPVSMSRPQPSSDRYPSKPSLAGVDSPIRGTSKLSFQPSVDVRDTTGEDRAPMALRDPSTPSTPASVSRPSSASRLSSYFSSKLNRLSRPASALLKRSSSATFSDAGVERAARPTSPARMVHQGSLGSWFHDRRSLLLQS